MPLGSLSSRARRQKQRSKRIKVFARAVFRPRRDNHGAICKLGANQVASTKRVTTVRKMSGSAVYCVKTREIS